MMRAPIIFGIPAGQTPDKTGADGLIGFMAATNSYAASMASYTTAASVSISGDDIRKGVIQLNAGAGGAFVIQLPSSEAILTALRGNVIPLDGTFSKPIIFVNNSVGQTGTVTAGDGNTAVVGTATVATATSRLMMLRVLGSTVTVTNVGSLTL